MENKKMKRTLVASILTLLLCVSTFIGGTFAWFNDTASTGVNKIVAGTLDIDLIDGNGASLVGKTLGFVNTSDSYYWEPGCKHKLETIKLKNNGNLNAKYKLVITAITGDVDLSEVIDVYEDDTKVGILKDFLNTSYGIKEGIIAPNSTVSFGELTLAMQTTAGNEYQGKSIENIAITVYTTQADAPGAFYPNQINASTQEEISNAITNATQPVNVVIPSGTFKNILDIPMKNKNVAITGTENTVIDLSDIAINYLQDMTGTTIMFENVEIVFSNANEGYQGVKNPKKVVYKDCTIKGTQFLYGDAEFINCKFISTSGYNVWTYDAKNVTFTDCTFTTGGRAILVYNEQTNSNFVANITLNNCTFTGDGSDRTGKGAVETGSNGGNTATSNKYNLVFTSCTADSGFSANSDGVDTKGSNLYGNKNNMDTDHLNVIIDGKDIY